MSSSNHCFLTCIQISQETDQMVWYSRHLKNFPQFVEIHTVKGFGIVNKAEVDVFLELSSLFDDPTDVGNLISGSAAFSKSSLNIWKFTVHILLKPALENFEHCFLLLCYFNWCHRENMFSWCLEGTFWTLTHFRRTVGGSGMKSLMEMKLWRMLYQRKLLAKSVKSNLSLVQQVRTAFSFW